MAEVKTQEEALELVVQYIDDVFGQVVTEALNEKLKETGLPYQQIDGQRLHDVIMHGLAYEDMMLKKNSLEEGPYTDDDFIEELLEKENNNED